MKVNMIFAVEDFQVFFNCSGCSFNYEDVFMFLPAFLDTDLHRGNTHERDTGPMQGAIPTQSYNP